MQVRYQIALLVSMLFLVRSVAAHEFWLEPMRAQLDVGDTIAVNIKVGTDMKGNTQVYNPRGFTDFVRFHNGSIFKVAGIFGDVPAAVIPDDEDGLHILAFASSANKLTYDKYEKFTEFLEYHGLEDFIATHDARGLSREGIKETYFRFAKALVPVGTGAGEDQELGLPLELTVIGSPFTPADAITMRLTFRKKPYAGRQVEVFWRAERGAPAQRSIYQSDADGMVQFPRRSGAYLVNAVRLEEPSARIAEELGSVWQSVWASSTFWIP